MGFNRAFKGLIYQQMHICNKIYLLIIIFHPTCFSALPEVGAISAETCRRLLIIMHVYYCICAFCWCINDTIYEKSTERKVMLEDIKVIQAN